MESMKKQISCMLGGKEIVFETGHLARQANGAVTATCGGTVVLVTVVAAKQPRMGTDFLPLTVDYREKISAAGKIPGGFFKREGRPTEKEILTSRIIDRPIRPLFPKGMRNEVQVIAWVLSSDGQNDPDIISVNAASAALMVSGLPFSGPIGGVRVGLIEGEYVINPTEEQLEKSVLDLVVVGSEDAIMMVEGGAQIVPEDVVLKGIIFGHEALKESCQAQVRFKAEVNPEPVEFPLQEASEAILKKMVAAVGDELPGLLRIKIKKERGAALVELRDRTFVDFLEEDPETEEWEFNAAYGAVMKKAMRQMVFTEGVRIDGRGTEDIRQITPEVGVLPRTHGSAIFTRGETQALVITTLGTPGDRQRIGGLHEGEGKTKRFMLHYNFPPFCTGEARPDRGPKRREIGHGHLAERSLLPVLPTEEAFPYTIRVVSDILSSNGSSSMASICGGSLSLMDAGVPVKAGVAGIAMGLLKGEDQTLILTDILGDEDAMGDMDFKVAGTRDGITGLQMDIKVKGISEEIMHRALSQARQARVRILDIMDSVQPAPRPEISPYAPKILAIQIDPDKIGLVIGPKGKNIKAMEKWGVTIDIEDDGLIQISSSDLEAAERARSAIEAMVAEVEVGQIYTGKVVSIKPFGAFVEIVPGKDGLVHISELDEHRVAQVEDVVRVDDIIKVKVINIDNLGRIKLSRKAVLAENKS
ncbi:MAG TPA: polyribonucleotide nucleotidyltransferase [bacterium]|nr:polyribonucleotide nucleotidyltransferase [bacterium]HPJ71365.1 polyribonucleotide nucleotidyltransferase [bacterium]